MTYRLVATDLDGTLMPTLLSKNEVTGDRVSPFARVVLDRAQRAGVWMVPVTARPPRSVVPVARAYGIHGYAVCGTGSLLYDLDRQEVLEEHILPSEVAARLVEGLRASHPGVEFAAERTLPWVREPSYGEPNHPISDVKEEDALTIAGSGVTKLLARHRDVGLDVLIEAARKVVGDGARVAHAAGMQIEIVANGATKAATLERLCTRLGVQQEEVIAFGNDHIDIPMIAWAGRGVAPMNARPNVITAADDVCDSNDEDGVARYLDRLLDDGLLRGTH